MFFVTTSLYESVEDILDVVLQLNTDVSGKCFEVCLVLVWCLKKQCSVKNIVLLSVQLPLALGY